MFAYFFLEEAGDFVLGEVDFAFVELAVYEFPVWGLKVCGVLEVSGEGDDEGVGGVLWVGLDFPIEEFGYVKDFFRFFFF